MLLPTRFPILSINANFAQNPLFLKACELAKVPPTKRQASAFRNHKGLAFRQASAARKLLGMHKETFIRCGVCGSNAPVSRINQSCEHCHNHRWQKLTMLGGRVVA